jgi:hypothetical protein
MVYGNLLNPGHGTSQRFLERFNEEYQFGHPLVLKNHRKPKLPPKGNGRRAVDL